MKMPQAPVKSNPVKDLHDEMEDLLVDAWDGKEVSKNEKNSISKKKCQNHKTTFFIDHLIHFVLFYC